VLDAVVAAVKSVEGTGVVAVVEVTVVVADEDVDTGDVVVAVDVVVGVEEA